MTRNDILTYVKNKLTAGGKVDLEVADQAIDTYIYDAFIKAQPWYTEPLFGETLEVTFSEADSSYILFSQFSKIPDLVYKVYPSAQTGMGSFDNDVAGLLSLEGKHIISQNMVSAAYALEFERQADTFLNSTLKNFMGIDRLYISGAVVYDSVTVLYYPKVDSMEDVTNPKAVAWMLDYVLASTKVAVGMIRSKFRGGDLGLDNDGIEMKIEGNTKIDSLMEELPKLSF
jgi:hypothetical protein